MRKSISVAFFSTVATLLILGVAVMGLSQLVLFSRYFAQERFATLDERGRPGRPHRHLCLEQPGR